MTNALDDAKASLAAMTTAKKALTASLTQLVVDFNAAPNDATKSALVAKLQGFVTIYDQLTLATNDLRARVTALQIGWLNVSDADMHTIALGYPSFWGTAISIISNICWLIDTKETALAMLDNLHADLRANVEAIFDSATEPDPTKSIVVPLQTTSVTELKAAISALAGALKAEGWPVFEEP